MTDILSRIKGWRTEPLADDPQHNWDWLGGMLDESGAEIEGLRAELAGMKIVVGGYMAALAMKDTNH